MIEEDLVSNMEKHGWRGRIVSAEHLRDLREEIQERYERGLLDQEFYRERLTRFDFRAPDTLPEARSIIVIAVPRPQSQAVFGWRGESRILPLPPTYVAYDETRKKVEALMEKILGAEGFGVSPARLPLKLLAVRSGLGLYGRNNICYVSGMGSFLQLAAVISDLPCTRDAWQEARMMERCQDCQACRLNCPTGAIPPDRFLLRAERCIVFHNERKGDIPFPDWIDSSWHNSVVGCMHCQRVCPENKDLLRWTEGREEFSEEETVLLLKGVPLQQLPPSTAGKLRNLDLIDCLTDRSLSRNLDVFFTR